MKGGAVRAVGAALLLAALPACGASDASREGEVLVSAAASLTDAFREMESAFEASHPELDVELNLGGSSSLRFQILEGAPVDVFASADTVNMKRVAERGAVSFGPVIFARNRLEIAVPPRNPAGITGLKDFADEELLIGLCAAEVPCGAFARNALARVGVTPAVDTNEPDVRALLTKVELGELDAGITYATDVAAAGGGVEGVEIPEKENVIADYPIAVLEGASNPDGARAFVDYTLSEEGRAILSRHGFSHP